MTSVRQDARSATELASAEAERAGVRIVELAHPQELAAVAALLAGVWRLPPPRVHLETGLLVALAHTGNYVVGAYRGDRLVGACVGFLAAPAGEVVHSHIAGVIPGDAGSGVGRALKLHQRAWALQRGMSHITWTFDPLIARNAYFNIHRLGSGASEYLVDFYGPMTDGLNIGQGSDRMLLDWFLLDDVGPRAHPSASAVVALHEGDDGEPVTAPVPAGATEIRLGIPSDIEALRVADPDLSARWRTALRSAMLEPMASGWRVIDFLRDGYYVLRKDA